MNKSIEISARTQEEAIASGLEQLGASISEVTIDILQEGSKGLFGLFGSRLAKVRLTLKEDADTLGEAQRIVSDMFRSSEEKPQPRKERAPKEEKPAVTEEAKEPKAPREPKEQKETREPKEPREKPVKKDPKDLQIEELKDKVIRQMAEFDNYRKRTEREKAQNYDIGASDFITKILPIVDNFERGMEALSEEEKETSYVQGFIMIYKQLKKVLDDAGVVEIEALGKEFDPLFHNAVLQQPSEEYESGVIMQVYRKGYMYKDKVLRHSMVIVAQ